MDTHTQKYKRAEQQFAWSNMFGPKMRKNKIRTRRASRSPAEEIAPPPEVCSA
ncbi:MAG: hypothetical protein Q8Q92_04945 [bacterium]|nr:hypothetical protein [bacterium]